MPMLPLTRPFDMQTTPRSIDASRAIQQILYPTNYPTVPFYPRPQSHSQLSGLGDCVPYDYPALYAAFGVEDCGACCSDSVESQWACVQRNAPKLNQIESMAGTCIQASQLPSGYTPTPGSAGAVINNPSQPNYGISYQPYAGAPFQSLLPAGASVNPAPYIGPSYTYTPPAQSSTSTTTTTPPTTQTPVAHPTTTQSTPTGTAPQTTPAPTPASNEATLFGLPQSTVLIGGGVLLAVVLLMGRR